MESHAIREHITSQSGHEKKKVIIRTVDRYTQPRGHKSQVYVRVELLQEKAQDAINERPVTLTLEWNEFRWKERSEAFAYAKQLSKEHHAKVIRLNIFS